VEIAGFGIAVSLKNCAISQPFFRNSENIARNLSNGSLLLKGRGGKQRRKIGDIFAISFFPIPLKITQGDATLRSHFYDRQCA
jgi:hypothetical protein